MSDENSGTILLLLGAVCGCLVGVLSLDGCQPPRVSCHTTVAECAAFCAPRGGVAHVELPAIYRCPQRRAVICTCRRS